MSIYDNIKTAKDLVFEVTAHGLSTKTEDICRAQDIFGNSTVEELAALATDNGRRDEDGTPNQSGNWSSGRDGTQKVFYQIIFTIWNWEEATKYYNEHSNPLYMEGCNAVKEQKQLKETIENQSTYINRLSEELTESKKAVKQLTNKKCEYQSEIDAKDAEIKTLREHALLPDDLIDVLQLVIEKRHNANKVVENAAKRIVEAATEPESATFKNAVLDHRAAAKDAEYYTELEKRLCKAKEEMNTTKL